jgi:AraC-like DNA-binding protein
VASFAGVTPITLRKNFRACLDLSVTAFVQRARLEWAFASLATQNESRPISELAIAAGYRSSQAFTTAFQRVFGDSPSLVRSRAVKEKRAA